MLRTLDRHVSAQLRAEMARSDVSNTELARRLGVNEMWVSRRARGRVRISLADLERIADALEVPVLYFVNREAAS